MKTLFSLSTILFIVLLSNVIFSQSVQHGYSESGIEDLTGIPEIVLSLASQQTLLPIEVDNSTQPFFPYDEVNLKKLIYDQTGTSSCTYVSAIFYAYTYERNRLLGVQGNHPANRFSPNSLWNYFNQGNPGVGDFSYGTVINLLKNPGVESEEVWGNLIAKDCKRWSDGYENYTSRRTNRIASDGFSYFYVTKNPESILTLKHYLSDHNEGGNSTGGLVLLPANWWGHPSVNLPPSSFHFPELVKYKSSSSPNHHAVAIVGYCDSVQYDWGGAFDQNGNPIPDGLFRNDFDNNGDSLINLKDWEIGAFKVADSYSDEQGNDGFEWVLYCVIANHTPFAITPEFSALPTFFYKVKIQHGHRLDLTVSTSIDPSACASIPNHWTTFYYNLMGTHQGGDFNMKGESYDPSTSPPYTPLLGPLEFAIDRTSIYNNPNIQRGQEFLVLHNINSEPEDYLIDFSIVDNRWNESFELECDQHNVHLNNGEMNFGIQYDLLVEGPLAPDITQNISYTCNQVSRFNPTVSNNATITFNQGVRLDMYNSNLLITQGSTLNLNDGSIIHARRGYNTITIQGDITVGFDVQFIADEGARLDIYLSNPNGTAEFSSSIFENTYLVSGVNNLYLNGCAMTGGNISGSGGNITLSGCTFTDAQLFAYFANAKTNFVDISECSFTGSEELYNAIELESYSTYSIQDCQINNYGGTGIALMNCGDNAIENRVLSGNTIKHTGLTEDWSAGVLAYNSFVKIHDNEEISFNAYGIQSLDNSQVSIKGNSAATHSNGTQQIKNNTFNQVYATQGAFPYYFRYNTVLDEDNSCLVYYDLIYEGVVDVRGNYWGPSFVASEDLCPDLDYYNYKPEWPLIYVPLGDGPATLLFESAQAKVETGDYSGAETDYKNVVSQYPESEYALSSMKELLALEKSTDADFAALKAYYATLTTTEDIERLAGYLANTCDIELENWPDAIAWLEDIIDNPSSYPDSLFAIIDLETVYQKMLNTGLKSSYVGRYPEFRKNSVAEFKKSRNYYLSLLFKRDNTSNTNVSDPNLNKLAVSPNPVVDFMTLTYNIENTADAKIIIYNSIGSKILEVSNLPNNTGINNHQLNLSDYPTGVYVCTLWINNKCVDYLKFIKK